MYRSLGIIEVVGMVTATACIDAMVKSAYVEVTKVERVGSGFLAVIIKGDLASVQVAIEIGAETAQSHGQLIAYRVIPRPYDGLEKMTAPEKG